MEISARYYSGSGFSLEEYCLLGERYNSKFGPLQEGNEYIILSSEDDDSTGFPLLTNDSLAGLWLSETGIAYVATSEGEIIHIPGDGEANRRSMDLSETFEVDSMLQGIWGLADNCIYAWGASWENPCQVFFFDGDKWEEIEAPEFPVRTMHGCAPDCIYAAGRESGIARWNGKKWKQFDVPVEENFTSIFVVSKKEQYAVGLYNYVLQGNGADWKQIARGPVTDPAFQVPLTAVAKWNGQLWFGSPIKGLMRRVGSTDQLEVIKPNIMPRSFDTRKELLITCDNMIAATSDGLDFSANTVEFLLEYREGKALNEFEED